MRKKKWLKPEMFKMDYKDTAFLESCMKDGCATYAEPCDFAYDTAS
ncbi:MAG: hypothetical protein AABY55_03760 [Candidatus Omnitrophota bacterium]